MRPVCSHAIRVEPEPPNRSRTRSPFLLTKEINGILGRYGRLQLRIMNKPKHVIQDAYNKFLNEELDRFKKETYNR